MTEVLIIGGGIAGSSLAILLGRQGVAVELFEQGKFPKEKPCGEGLMPAGVAVLERLGLANSVEGAPFYGIRHHFAAHTTEARFPKSARVLTMGRGLRRRRLDEALFRAAAATTYVTAYAGTRVTGLLRENGRVTGVSVEGGARRAKLVVAADGVHSRTRHLLGLDVPDGRKRIGACAHFRLASGREPPPWVEVFVSAGHEIYVTPLPQRELMVACLADAKIFEKPIEEAFDRRWRAQPSLAARLEGAEQITSLQCISPLAGCARSGVAPGIVLLGDAAGFLDPITGGGMTQALQSAELLAGYLPRGLAAKSGWLRSFETERMAMLRDYRRLTRIMLWLADHPKLPMGLLSLVRLPPSILSHLAGVAGGSRSLLGLKGQAFAEG